MKRWLGVMLCVGTMATLGFGLTEQGASPRLLKTWAALKDSGAPSKAQFENALQAPLDLSEKTTLLPKIMQGETLRVQIIMPPEEVGVQGKMEGYQGKVTKSFEDWSGYVQGQVQQRCGEDKTCLESFKRVNSLEVKIKFVSEYEDADLRVFLEDDLKNMREYTCEDPNCVGLFRPGNKHDPMTVFLYYKDLYYGNIKEPIPTWTHEFGHVLGLADMYPSGFEEGADAIVRSANQDRTKSMMDSTHDGVLSQFGCEDADGLINLVDQWTIYFAKAEHGNDFQRHLLQRLINGWQSFCPSAEWYKPLEMAEKIEGGVL